MNKRTPALFQVGDHRYKLSRVTGPIGSVLLGFTFGIAGTAIVYTLLLPIPSVLGFIGGMLIMAFALVIAELVDSKTNSLTIGEFDEKSIEMLEQERQETNNANTPQSK